MICISRAISVDDLRDPITVKPIFDVHFGHRLCDVKALKEHLNTDKNNSWIVTGGDIGDTVILTDKRFRRSMDSSDSDDILNYQTEKIVEIFEPYRDRILGWGDGNHERRVVRIASYNLSKSVSERLGVTYLGYSWFLTLLFRDKKNGTHSHSPCKVVIYGHHGFGGASRTEGGSITKYCRHAKQVIADICLYGHDHVLDSMPLDLIGTTGTKQKACKRYVVICGTFMKTFSDSNNPAWSEEMGFPARSIGAAKIKIWPKSGKYGYPLIRVET